MKKIYTCKHQKNSTNPCATCKEGRENKTYITKVVSVCGKCGEAIEKGSYKKAKAEDNEEYREEWFEECDCQSNSEKVKQKGKQQEEVEIKCKLCGKNLIPRQGVVEIKNNEGKVTKSFCSLECLDKYDNQQKGIGRQKNNQSDNSQSFNQQNNYNDKK